MRWEDYFINMLDSIKIKSKDRSTKVGAVIVGENNNILSTGYNGFPRGVMEDGNDINVYAPGSIKKAMCDEIESRHSRPDKYMWTEHAERNAIFNAARHGIALNGSRIYVDWYPCADCARAIIQSGIVKVFIDSRNEEEKEKYWNERWKDNIEIAKKMFVEAGIKVIKYKGKTDG